MSGRGPKHPALAGIMDAEQPEAGYVTATAEEANQVAQAWQRLRAPLRACLRDIIFTHAAIGTLYPWLIAGHPTSDAYDEWEARVRRDIEERLCRSSPDCGTS